MSTEASEYYIDFRPLSPPEFNSSSARFVGYRAALTRRKHHSCACMRNISGRSVRSVDHQHTPYEHNTHTHIQSKPECDFALQLVYIAGDSQTTSRWVYMHTYFRIACQWTLGIYTHVLVCVCADVCVLCIYT